MTLTQRPPGRGTARPERAATNLPESRYLKYLPGLYRQDPFVARFLLIFESVMGPLETLVDNLPLYTEPATAPEEFLPWLAHWVAVSLDAAWPRARQRALIANAVEIYRWRGTRRGLKLHIAAYTGSEPLIQEHASGFVVGQESRLGWTTTLFSTPPQPNLFVVTVPVAEPAAVDEKILRAIVEEDKPAHTIYELHVVRDGRAVARAVPVGMAIEGEQLRSPSSNGHGAAAGAAVARSLMDE
jgi:phage tail-like protein